MAYPYSRLLNPYENLQSTAQKKVEVIEPFKNNATVSVMGKTTKNPVAPTVQQKTAASLTVAPKGEVNNFQNQLQALNTSGLNEAYTRIQRGIANEADKANVKYAQGRGWSPATPATPSNIPNIPEEATTPTTPMVPTTPTPTTPQLSSMYTPTQPEEVKTLTSRLADIQSKIAAKQTAIEQGDINLVGGEVALEGQGRGIPLTLIRGQQGKLELQRQIAKQTEQTELAGLQREEAGLLSQLKTAGETYKAEKEQYAPTAVGNQIIQYNPTTGKYETLYQVPEEVETVAVGAGQAIIDKKTGKVIYQAPAKENIDLTSDIQNYNFYRVQELNAGRTPKSFDEWGSAGKLGLTSAQINSTVNSIASAFDNEQLVKDYNQATSQYQLMNSIGSKTSNPGDDIALVYAFAKIMDPNSVVREGEYNTVQRYAQSFLDAKTLEAIRLVKNTNFLSQDAKQQLINAASAKMKVLDTQYKNIYNEYQRQIQDAYSGNPRSITSYSGAFGDSGSTTGSWQDDL